jgi:2-polyprenyl-3-methyl-5-hydroxy-6-metoxy-1,4-benzoquinol methylase
MSHSASAPIYGDYPRNEMHPYLPAGARRVLDVGCHTGAFGRSLKRLGVAEVWGVEMNAEAAAGAAAHLDRVLVGAFSAELVPDGHFDAIFFNDVLEHMSDPGAALRAAVAKLTPGGKVVASIPNLRHIDNLEHMLLDKDFRYEANGVRDLTHLRFFTRKSIPRLFEQNGYTVEQLAGINESWWTPQLWRRLAFRLFPGYLADTRFIQYAVVAAPGAPA